MATLMLGLTVVLSVFLILLILIQRGRGGGLAGAFGGLGGQSAIGTRAGDVFTRITVVVVLVWLALNGVTGVLARQEGRVRESTRSPRKNETGKGDSTKDVRADKANESERVNPEDAAPVDKTPAEAFPQDKK